MADTVTSRLSWEECALEILESCRQKRITLRDAVIEITTADLDDVVEGPVEKIDWFRDVFHGDNRPQLKADMDRSIKQNKRFLTELIKEFGLNVDINKVVHAFALTLYGGVTLHEAGDSPKKVLSTMVTLRMAILKR